MVEPTEGVLRLEGKEPVKVEPTEVKEEVVTEEVVEETPTTEVTEEVVYFKNLPNEINNELNKIEKENYSCSQTGDCVLAANDVIDLLEENNINFNIVSGLVETNKLYKKGERGLKSVEGRELRSHVLD